MAGANNPGKNNRMNVNMPRPSWMWIYGVIGILILGYYVFGDSNDTPVRSDWTAVERMVERGEVEKIRIVNRDAAQVFLRPEAAARYRADTTEPAYRRLPETGAQLTFTIGSVDAFREDLRGAEEASGYDVPVVYENRDNGWMNLLVNLLS